MTSSKFTKRALVCSALAIVMCVAMLIGSTFAWFTDTASVGVNKIQAGNLDVALEMQDASGNWVSAEGKTLDFKKAAGAEDEQILWEPGCCYELPALRVVNKGNLALKYKIQVTGIQGDAKLNAAINWEIGTDTATDGYAHLAANESKDVTIKGTMRTTAGNEYKNLSIDGIAITVFATQDTVEYDSFNNTYDADAVYDFTAAKETVSAIFADVYNSFSSGDTMTWEEVQAQRPAVANVSFYTPFSTYSGDAPESLVISGAVYTASSTIKISIGNNAYVEDKVFYCENGIVYLAAPMAIMEAADSSEADMLTVNQIAFRNGDVSGSVTQKSSNNYAVTIKKNNAPLCVFYDGAESTDLAITRKVSTSPSGVTSVAYGTTGMDHGTMECTDDDYALRFFPAGWSNSGDDINAQLDGASMQYTIYVQGKGMMKLNFTYSLGN